MMQAGDPGHPPGPGGCSMYGGTQSMTSQLGITYPTLVGHHISHDMGPRMMGASGASMMAVMPPPPKQWVSMPPPTYRAGPSRSDGGTCNL